jgi:uncharacterized protein
MGDLKGELGEIEVDGLKVGIYHGTSKVAERLINSGEYNILVCGHTHTKEAQEHDAPKFAMKENGK